MGNNFSEKYQELWEQDTERPDVFDFLDDNQITTKNEILSILFVDQKFRWQVNDPIVVEEYLQQIPEINQDQWLTLQLALSEFENRLGNSLGPETSDYLSRFPEISKQLESQIDELMSGSLHIHDQPLASGSVIACEGSEDKQFGRYRVRSILGEGAYGRVYLGFDEELQRQVAIKVPMASRFKKPEDAEAYLREARTVAALNHPNIVPVHDVGRGEDGSVFVVSKFIAGGTLREKIDRQKPGYRESAKLIATVAGALHHAHQRRLIHRDIKPSNILIDSQDETPFVADFGLAISQDDYFLDSRISGTPSYMSPEQASGQGKPLDHKSDVFALGVVLYEMLTATRPFRGNCQQAIIYQVVSVDPELPTLIDPEIPTTLQNICMKALAKAPQDRFDSAEQLSGALNAYLASSDPDQNTDGIQINGRTQQRLIWLTATSLATAILAFVLMRSPDREMHLDQSEDSPISRTDSAGTQTPEIIVQEAVASRSGPSSRIALFELVQLQNLKGSGPQENDEVGMNFKLRRKGYFFLVALNPDGVTQLIHPSSEDVVQTEPLDDKYIKYALTDGAGPQGFMVVTSETPLPSFAQWRQTHPIPWPQGSGYQGNWRYQNGEFDPVRFERGTLRVDQSRGGVTELEPPPDFADYFASTDQQQKTQTQAIFFSVNEDSD